jgi:hypothetical protein
VSVSVRSSRGARRAPVAPPNNDAADEETFRPYRRLALHVLARAVRDLIGPKSLADDRDSARVFFADSRMLAHWCRVAALDPRSLAERAAAADAALTAGSAGPRRSRPPVSTPTRRPGHAIRIPRVAAAQAS